MNPSSKKKLIKRHEHMVNDPYRTPLIEKSIQKSVSGNSVVFEIGCGTGILTLAALKAGAKKVYSCEIDRVLSVAKENIDKSGYGNQVQFYKGLSIDFEITEKIDVLIVETVGSLGFNENILYYLVEARDRLLKKNGFIIPAKLSVFLAPTTFKPSGKLNKSDFQIFDIPKQSIAAREQKYFEANFKTINEVGFDSEYSFSFNHNVSLTGMAGWIEVDWGHNLKTNSSPFHPQTHWKQCFLPFSEPINVKTGDELLFRLIMGPDEENPLEALIEWGYLKK